MTLAVANPTLQTTGAGMTTDTLDWSSVHAVAVVQLKTVSGSPDSQVIQLKGSLDGVNYYNLGATITVVGGIATVSTQPFRYTQVTNTQVNGTAPTVTVVVGVGA